MKLLRNICRILVGIVFIYSGFVKGVDPLGSDYKFTDYFNASGMSWMGFSTLFFSFLLSMAEFLIGICLFLNIKIKTAAWGAILFMGFFTPLTLILAIKNPVTDCGCFGDALILTNWETFWKNIILLAMTLVIFYTRDKYKPIFNFLEQTVVLVGTVFSCSVYNGTLSVTCLSWISVPMLSVKISPRVWPSPTELRMTNSDYAQIQKQTDRRSKRLYRRKLSLARYRKLGICRSESETDQRRI